MTELRREFLKTSVAATALWAAGQSAADDSPKKLGVGLIGPGGMGTGHLNQLVQRKDIDLRWVVRCGSAAAREGS